jgi:hypothetical protein
MKLLLFFFLTVYATQLNPTFTFALVANTAITAVAPVFIFGDTGMSAMHAGSNAVTPIPPSIMHGEDGQGQIAQDNAVIIKAQFPPPPACTGGAAISGAVVLTPGSYCYPADLALSGSLTLDGQGDPNALFIFNVITSITTATAFHMTLINQASSCNVYFLVGQSVTMGTATVFVGNVIAGQSITTVTGTSVTGYLVAQSGAISLGDQTTVNALGCTTSTSSTSATSTIAPTTATSTSVAPTTGTSTSEKFNVGN